MAASSVQRKASLEELSADLSNGSSALFHRRIEFHPARKPYRGFVNGGGDFRIETLNPSNDSARPGIKSGQSGLVGKKSEAFEESGLDPELSFAITFKSIGAGLENMGNTCYLNSVLQCLTYTEPLAAYLQSGKHKNSCRIAGFCALCAIQKHVSRALQSTGRCLSPHEIVANLKCISRNFRSCRQEDAHEYMVNLLESMHKCCLPSGVPSESPGAYEKSLVHKIFGGSLRSQVKCLQCSYGSNKYDPFLDLSLEINKADSLDKALLNFTAAELLDGGERQYQCERCKQKVRARKQLTVHKPPYVLTIHLKRFRAHDPGQKIDKKVNFSPTLDLRPFVSDPQGGNLKYTLYGVLVHSGGSTRSGHYYCFVRTSSGIWHSLDDNRVSPVSEKRVLEQKAYMLFYVRDRSNIIPRKPSNISIRENVKANDPGKINSSENSRILRNPVQNESNDARMKHVDSSAVVVQNDVAGVVPTPMIATTSDRLDRPKCELSTTTSHPKNPSELVSIPPKTPEKNLEALHASNDSNGTPNVPVDNTDELNDKGSLDKSLKVSVLTSTDPKEVCSSAKQTITGPLHEIRPASYVESAILDSSKASATVIEKTDTVKQPDQPGCQDSQAEITTHGSVGDISLHKKTDECSQILVVEKSVKLPDLSSTPRSTHTGASDCKSFEKSKKKIGSVCDNSLLKKTDESSQILGVEKSVKLPKLSSEPIRSTDTDASGCKLHAKFKKKIVRHQVASLGFNPRFLRVSLAVQKKKKNKRSTKRPASGSNNLTKELLVENNSVPEVVPSTSEKTNMVSLNSTKSPRKESKVTSRIEASGTASQDKITPDSDSLKIVADDGGFMERTSQNGSELAQDDQILAQPNCRVSVNQMIGMLTKGLGDPIVRRWDDEELPSRNVEFASVPSATIGYIGDEWDEEYDKGKRKKVRLARFDFDGKNPFQEIANNRAKKAKIDRSRSGNQPFRIGHGR